MSEPQDPNQERKSKVVRFGRRPAEPPSADVIPISAPAHQPLPLTFSGNAPQRIIAGAVILVATYFGRMVIIPILVSVLLAFVLAPLVGRLERWHVPRPLGAGIGLMLLAGLLYLGSYFFYLRAVEFVHELPRFTEQIRASTIKYRKQAQVLRQTREAIVPQAPEEQNAVRVRPVESSVPAGEGTLRLVDALVAASFVPFLTYFMLSWQSHVHSATVQLFAPENRTNAYVTLSNMVRMMRGFILGNLIVGLLLGIASSAIFWWLGVPYFYFIGFISGFVSLLPYLGVVLALAPPLATALGSLSPNKLAILAGAVIVLHLIGVNVLYPKILGRHLQLNPLAVTVALLFFWFLWGGMGLLLAVPVTAAIKIVCDHIPELGNWGFWLSDGESEKA